jgi:hypothetical protein
MNPGREAITLPTIFLTVVLLGGARIGDTAALVPASLFTLVLATLLAGLLVQSGALAPERLLSTFRSELANTNGLIVLGTLWAAAAQVFAMLTPESGLPRVAVSVFFALMLLNTAAAAPDRVTVLRSLAVTFGGAFVLKFVVLHGLSAPGTGMVKRAMQAALDGVTLGTLLQPVPRPITGYLAFATLALFLFGVFLLPSDTTRRSGLMRRTERDSDALSRSDS